MDRVIQPAGSGVHSPDNIAALRSDIRERHEREERARLNPQQDFTPTQRLGQMYGALWMQEQEEKRRIRAHKIRTGRIVIDPVTGIETEYL
jgi:hypothetical protein